MSGDVSAASVQRVPDDQIDALLETAPGWKATHEPCAECGLLPGYYRTEYGVTRVDGCLGFLREVVSACCGHGGRKPAYLRIATDATDGGVIDICGGTHMDYGAYADESRRRAHAPP